MSLALPEHTTSGTLTHALYSGENDDCRRAALRSCRVTRRHRSAGPALWQSAEGSKLLARDASAPVVATPATCPRCGSARLQSRPILYADGPVPANLCLECGYLDLQRLPTYISPSVTTKVDNASRRLPAGNVLGIARQAGVIDEEGGAGGTAAANWEHS